MDAAFLAMEKWPGTHTRFTKWTEFISLIWVPHVMSTKSEVCLVYENKHHVFFFDIPTYFFADSQLKSFTPFLSQDNIRQHCGENYKHLEYHMKQG